MDLTTIGEVIAERLLVLVRPDGSKHDILVSLGKPERRAGLEDYYCPYQIIGFSEPRISYAAGVDCFQAIQLALLKLGTELELRNNSEEGQLFWLHEVDLGFPVADRSSKGSL
jgi:hypothetical protein